MIYIGGVEASGASGVSKSFFCRCPPLLVAAISPSCLLKTKQDKHAEALRRYWYLVLVLVLVAALDALCFKRGVLLLSI